MGDIDASILERLAVAVRDEPGRVLYRWIRFGGQEPEVITAADLWNGAMRIAQEISCSSAPGDRVLLFYPPGPEFLFALWGTFLSGRIAVPAYPPQNAKHRVRIGFLLQDCLPTLILTVEGKRQKIENWLPPGETDRLSVVATDQASGGVFGAQDVQLPGARDTAFLQYTSGSTSQPKGVRITWANVAANAEMIRWAFALDEQSTMVSWLPLYHDMGLVGHIFAPFHSGSESVLFSPFDFIQSPIRWMEVISKYRGQVTGAPNFAWDLCARRMRATDITGLDLSTLRLAYLGSEMTNAETLRSFAEAARPAGFKAESLLTCYGMAESTLISTASPMDVFPRVLTFDRESVSGPSGRPREPSGDRQRREVVSCGRSVPGQELVVVDPDSRRRLPDNEIGEAWIRGAHIFAGYWGKDEEGARLDEADCEGGYFRTGDMGFMRDGELFVTGRRKELIILRGRNFSPHDVEILVMNASEAFARNGLAALQLQFEGEPESMGLAIEIRRDHLRGFDGEHHAALVRQELADHYEITPRAIVFLRPARLPRTSSGKIRRRPCAEQLVAGDLDPLYSWEPGKGLNGDGRRNQPDRKKGEMQAHASAQRADEVAHWLRKYAAERVNSRLIDERRCITPSIVLDFGNRGLLGLQAPLEAGGLQLDYRDAVRIMEQLSAIDVTLGSFVGVHNSLGVRPLMSFGSEAQKQRVLGKVASGRELISFAFTEPAAGSNPRGIKAQAVPDGVGNWILNGEKKWIGTAAWSSHIIVFAHLIRASGTGGDIVAILLDRGLDGVKMGPEELTSGMRGMVQNTVLLQNVTVTADDILGGIGKGMEVAQDTMRFGRFSIGAFSLGIAKRSAQLVTRYASQREIGTGQLIDNFLLRSRLTEMTMRIAALEAFVRAMAEWLDAGHEVPEEWYAAIKVVGPETAFWCADQLIQLLGGRGYIDTNLAPQIWRDARLLRIFEGPTETMMHFLGTRLLYDPKPFVRFASESLALGELAAEVEDFVHEVKRQALDAERLETSESAQQAAYALGESGVYALWVTAARWWDEHDDSRLRPGVLQWLDGQWRKYQARALSSANQPQPDSGEALSKLIDGYRGAIGDVSQSAAHPLAEIDPKLAVLESADPPTDKPLSEPVSIAAEKVGRDVVLSSVKTHTRWLQTWLAKKLETVPEKIDQNKSFSEFGLDSISAVELTGLLARETGFDISPTAAWDYPSIVKLARHLSSFEKPEKRESQKADPGDEQRGMDLQAQLRRELLD